MPVVFRWKGYRFFFFSNEGDPREPLHIHVRKGQALTKFWLEPEVRLGSCYGMTAQELNRLKIVVEENAGIIREAWNEFFGD